MNDTSTGSAPGEETLPLGAPATGQQTLDPDAPAPTAEAPGAPPAAPYPGPYATAYAGPGGPQPAYPAYPGYPGYPPAPRPRFRDQVLGMRAVIAVALVALVIGGLGGALLGALSNNGNGDRFGGPPGFGQGFHRGGFNQGGFGQGGFSQQGQQPHQQFGQGTP